MLHGLGLTESANSNDKTVDTTEISVYLEKSEYSFFTSTVSSSSLFYSNIDRTQKYATLFLAGDVIRTSVIVEQYQKWWWGDQRLYRAEVDAYVICNLHDYVEYANY